MRSLVCSVLVRVAIVVLRVAAGTAARSDRRVLEHITPILRRLA